MMRLKIMQYDIIFCLVLISIAAVTVGGRERAAGEARVEPRGYFVGRRRGEAPGKGAEEELPQKRDVVRQWRTRGRRSMRTL